MTKVSLQVFGNVQGVGFRFSVCQLARQFETVTGRVWNNVDGTVGIYAQSDNAIHLKQFIERVQANPSRFGRVERVVIQPATFENYDDFKEIYGTFNE